MKIAIFTDTFLPQINGVVTHVVETVKELAKLGHSILIIAPKSKKNITIGKNVKIEYLSGLPALFYPDFVFTTPFSYQLLKKVKKFAPDIIHFHTPIMIGLNAILIAKYLKVPLVSTFHTYFMEPEYLRTAGFDRLNLDNNKLINNIGWQIAKIFHDLSDIIIVPAKFTKDDLINHGFVKPIIRINNGIKLPNKQNKMFNYNLGKYFLYVGRLSKEKNLDILFKAYRIFCQKNKNIRLIIVGDGPDKNNLMQSAYKKGLEQRIVFLGLIPHKKLLNSDIFTQAIAFVTTSTSEVQGLSIIEACSYKLPVIAVKTRSMNELITNNGILVDKNDIDAFADALKRIVLDDLLRRDLSLNSFAVAKIHLLSNTVKQLEKVYFSLIKK